MPNFFSVREGGTKLAKLSPDSFYKTRLYFGLDTASSDILKLKDRLELELLQQSQSLLSQFLRQGQIEQNLLIQ